jgi:hypothetical protein
VSSTILMVIVLVVMWLVVLVPMFVRRHDSDVEDGQSDAGRVRVLNRRSTSRARSGAAPGRPAAGLAVAAFSHDRARRRMLRRRRRTLLILLVLAAASSAAAVAVSPAMWAVQVFADLLLVSYLGWLRQQVRRERARRLRRAALSARTAPAPFPAPIDRAGHRRRTSTARAERTAPWAADRAIPSDTAAPAPATGGSWDPVPVPVPTYVTAPAASRPDSVVSIDDDDPAFVDIDSVIEPIERRRAANG